MTSYVQQPPAVALTQWTVGDVDNTDDIITFIINSGTVTVDRYNSTGASVVLRFYDTHDSTLGVGYIENHDSLWIGLHDGAVDIPGRLIVVSDNGSGTPQGYSTFASVYG